MKDVDCSTDQTQSSYLNFMTISSKNKEMQLVGVLD